MKWFALFMALLGVVLTSVGIFASTDAVTQKRLVCFDIQGNYKMSVKGENYRFADGVVYGEGDQGKYAIYPMPGWICSIVSAE